MSRTNVVKAKYFNKDGSIQEKEYTFYTDREAEVGDIMEVKTRGRWSDVYVSQIDVDPAEIEPFKDRAATLMKKNPPTDNTEEQTNE